MKKIITVLLSAVLALTLFCGCAGGDGTDALRKALEYPLTLDAESGELAFVLTLETNENATAKMTAPRTLSGLDLVKNKNGVTASYKGMTVPLPEASAEEGADDAMMRALSERLRTHPNAGDARDGLERHIGALNVMADWLEGGFRLRMQRRTAVRPS